MNKSDIHGIIHDVYTLYGGKKIELNYETDFQLLCAVIQMCIRDRLCGATNPAEAEMGTLRADYSNSIGFNIIHGSDSVENAEIEIKRFFPEGVESYERKVI